MDDSVRCLMKQIRLFENTPGNVVGESYREDCYENPSDLAEFNDTKNPLNHDNVVEYAQSKSKEKQQPVPESRQDEKHDEQVQQPPPNVPIRSREPFFLILPQSIRFGLFMIFSFGLSLIPGREIRRFWLWVLTKISPYL